MRRETASERADLAERERVSDSALCVWVPPGVTPLVSEGITVRQIGGEDEPSVRRRRHRRRKNRGDHATKPVADDASKKRFASDPSKDRPTEKDLLLPVVAKSPVRPNGASAPAPPPAPLAPASLPGTLSLTHPAGTFAAALWTRAESGAAEELRDDLTVPPELEAEAQEAMKHWDMQVTGMQLMATKPEKGGAIWRIETDRGPRSLKRLHRSPARSLFSIGLQDYVVKQGARVPRLIPTRNGDLFAQVQERLWIVTDWIEGLTPAPKDLEGARALCYGLGEFHRHSRGYEPPPGAEIASRLHRWPRTYQKMATKMEWFREVARLYPDAPASATVLALVDRFEEQARQALQRLEASPYENLAARSGPAWGVVHQDYGWSNGQLGPGGVWIIDLDGVAYDLPIRDLRKLITSTMDDMGVWDPGWMRAMMEAYQEANPIEPELYQVLLIDMSLPNEFYKHVKDMLMDPLTFLSSELDQLLQRLAVSDETKWRALRELGLDASPAVAASVPGGGNPW